MALADPHKKCDWSDLHNDLLELIFKRLRHAGDLIRFGAVCMPWRSIAKASRQQIIKPLCPLLLLPRNNDNGVYKLFDFSTNKAHKIQLPEIGNAWCCNSSKDWLVTINFTPPYEIHFLNPFTRVQIQLPPATTFEDPPPRTRIDETPIEGFIYKAIASSSPSDPNCVFMAIYSNWGKLAFCKPGDTKWKTLRSEINNYRDVIYFKDKFYALGLTERIVLCEIGDEPKVIEVVPPVRSWRFQRKYLVESPSRDLLKVLRRLDWEDTPDGESSRYKTVMFEVCKLDFGKGKSEVVKSLGENLVLMGHNASMLLSAKDFPEFRGDCIYFTDDYLEGYFEKTYGCHDMGVFSLKTQQFQQFEPIFQFSRIWPSPLFWVAPDVPCMS